MCKQGNIARPLFLGNMNPWEDLKDRYSLFPIYYPILFEEILSNMDFSELAWVSV